MNSGKRQAPVAVAAPAAPANRNCSVRTANGVTRVVNGHGGGKDRSSVRTALRGRRRVPRSDGTVTSTGRVVKMRVPGSISRATTVNSPSPTASCFRSAQVLGRCKPLCIRQFNQGRFQFELRLYLPRVNKASFQKVSRLRMTSSKMELPPSRGRRSPPELFTHYLTLAPLLCYCGEMGATPPSLGTVCAGGGEPGEDYRSESGAAVPCGRYPLYRKRPEPSDFDGLGGVG